MFEKLSVMQMAQSMAKHGATRQSVIAQNVANADTPGYRARDVASFAETYRPDDGGQMRTTRPGHMLAGERGGYSVKAGEVYRPDAASPNGNNVSIEEEMFAAAEAKSEHERALAIYRSSMNILRTSASGRG